MSVIFRVGAFEIDDDLFELRHGSRPVAIEPRVLELIIYLVRHRDRLVSKRELLTQVWNGYAVGDSAIARCICIARQMLRRPNAVKTVFGRGYRWAAPVRCRSSPTRARGRPGR